MGLEALGPDLVPPGEEVGLPGLERALQLAVGLEVDVVGDRRLIEGHGGSVIEELITELKNDYTVVIVTHNMQQAARCSDYTAYMYLGDLMEFGSTEQMFFKPARKETEDYITGRFG